MPGFASGSPCLFQFTPLREGRQFVTPGFTGVPISIHAPPRGATGACASLLVRVVAFQFTPLREGRPISPAPISSGVSFQFTPLREGRLDPRRRSRYCKHFNSRPSARGDLLWLSDNVCPANFNSRPSARGDDYRRLHHGRRWHISIHAPPRGATLMETHKGNHYVLFQFTPLREGRPVVTPSASANLTNFNSRPSARGDYMAQILMQQDVFQFTPLREGRRAWRVLGLLESHFNSRPSARGDDEAGDAVRQAHPISIHAPPRGATRGAALGTPRNTFQFTPLREGRHVGIRHQQVAVGISIHAPPRGATGNPGGKKEHT